MPVKHGLRKTRTYRIWSGMKTRCYNQKEKSYKYYGARGIKVCEAWHDFNNFFKDMGHVPKNHSIERIDNDGNYSPENCKWIPLSKQMSNTSRSRYLTYNDKRKTLAQWSRDTGIGHATILYRLKAKWTIGQALGFQKKSDVRPWKWRFAEVNGERLSLAQICIKYGISRGTLENRLYKQGLTPEMAVNKKPNNMR